MSDTCYLYCMEQEDRIKIGISGDPDQRANSIRLNSGLNTECVWRKKYETREEAKNAESFCHRFFDDNRLHGEWFRNISVGDVESSIREKYALVLFGLTSEPEIRKVNHDELRFEPSTAVFDSWEAARDSWVPIHDYPNLDHLGF